MATETLNLNLNEANPQEESPTDTLDLPPADDQELLLDPAHPPPSTCNGADDASQKGVVGSSVAPVGLVAGNAAPDSDVQKKIRRAERFGMPVQLSEAEKRNSRAERFGTASTAHGSDSSKKAEELKRKARAERFGITVPPDATDEEAKKKARLARFTLPPKTDAVEEDKRKSRALRFAEATSSSLQRENAIAGKASGVA